MTIIWFSENYRVSYSSIKFWGQRPTFHKNPLYLINIFFDVSPQIFISSEISFFFETVFKYILLTSKRYFILEKNDTKKIKNRLKFDYKFFNYTKHYYLR